MITSAPWRHFKRGGCYKLIALAVDSVTGQANVVYQDYDDPGGPVWTRPLVGTDGWCEVVAWPDGRRRPRFVPEAALEREQVDTPRDGAALTVLHEHFWPPGVQR